MTAFSADNYGVSIPESLVDFVDGRGDPHQYCLKRGYSPITRVLCVDFSPWLCARILAGDPQSVIDFVWEVVRWSPPVSTGSPQQLTKRYESEIRSTTSELLNTDLSRYIVPLTQQGLVELQCALILASLRCEFDAFAMIHEAPAMLAKTIGFNRYLFQNLSGLTLQANVFISEMQKCTDFWKGFALIDESALALDANPSSVCSSEFVDIMCRLPMGSRAHFFDLLGHNTISSKFSFDSINASSAYHKTRYWGLDLDESAARLLKCGLLEPVRDPVRLFGSWTKLDLCREFSSHKIPFRPSWPRAKLVAHAAENLGASVAESVNEHKVVEVPQRFRESATKAVGYYLRLMPVYQMLLGFGVSKKPMDLSWMETAHKIYEKTHSQPE